MQRKDRLNQEIREIERRLAVFPEAAELRSFLKLQDCLDVARSELARCDDAIAKQRVIVGSDGTAQRVLDDLEAARTELLAQIALGVAEESSLAPVDRRIEKARQLVVAGDTKVRDARGALAGLERLRESAAAKVAELEAGHEEALRGLLQSEAERLAGEYQVLAAELVELFGRLGALETLGRAVGGPAFFGPTANDLLIPALKLRAFEGRRPDVPPGVYAAGLPRPDVAKVFLEREAARFAELGVRL